MSALRIAIDARELEEKPTGVGRYLANLLRYWARMDNDHSFILLCRQELDYSFIDRARIRTTLIPSGVLKNDTHHQQVNLYKVLKKEQPDVFFAPSYTMPLLWKGPSVLTIHDISFTAHPEWFSMKHGMKMRFFTRRSAQLASAILTVSDFTKNEVVRRYGIPEGKLTTIYHGVDNSLLQTEFTKEPDLRKRLNFNGPFALMVGSIFERRFPLETIAAFSHLKNEGLGLVIVGDDRRKENIDLNAFIRQSELQERVCWLQYCSEADLCGLYRCADQLIYLSAYEGFGLPPLEGMLFGLPAVVSNRGALKEIYGRSAMLVHEENAEQISATIRTVHSDKQLRAELIEKGAALVESLSLQSCAEKTLELIVQTGGK